MCYHMCYLTGMHGLEPDVTALMMGADAIRTTHGALSLKQLH